MASLVSGITFLENFGFYAVLFPLILITAIVYGILSQIKPFGDDAHVNIIVSLVIAFMFISVAPVVSFIKLLVPFATIFLIVIMFVLIMFQFLGVKSDVMQEAFAHPAVYGLIIVVMLIAIFFFISESVPELTIGTNQGSSSGGSAVIDDEVIINDDGSTTVIISGDEDLSKRQGTLRNTVFHPTILALLVLVLVFGSAVYMIAVVGRD
jgi:hypothetical protein